MRTISHIEQYTYTTWWGEHVTRYDIVFTDGAHQGGMLREQINLIYPRIFQNHETKLVGSKSIRKLDGEICAHLGA